MTSRLFAGVLVTAAVITGGCEQAREAALAGAAPAPATATRDSAVNRWPGEPKQFVTVTDQPWDLIVRPGADAGRVGRLMARARALLLPPATAESDWSYLRRSSSKDDDIIGEAGAPSSPPNVLRIVFTTDMQRDHEPSVHFIGLPRVTEIYAGWWMKLSPNWTCSPAGCGKITFLFPESASGGVIYSNLAGTNGSHYVDVATTWPSTGYKFWQPNVRQTPVDNDRWHQIEWYVKWASHADAADGIVRWWVNGELNGDYRNVPFPATRGFVEFQHASTRQDPPPTEQYMYIDHTYVSTPVQQTRQP